jgi:multiple sugar transport system permease protein
MLRSHRASQNLRLALAWLFVLLALLFLLFPFYWMALTALKSNRELYDITAMPLWIRDGITLEHFSSLLQGSNFPVWLKNSLLVSTTVTLITLFVSVPAAYAIVRLTFPGQNSLALGVFLAYLVPPTLLFIPLARTMVSWGLFDSLGALVAAYPTFTVPFATWLLMGYFKGIPKDLEEAAMVDGASRLRALWAVVLPVASPGLITVTLFAFTLSWGHMIYAMAFVSRSTEKVLPVGLVTEMVRGDVFFWGPLMAGALLAAVPVLILFAFLTRYFVAGLTAGATKY